MSVSLCAFEYFTNEMVNEMFKSAGEDEWNYSQSCKKLDEIGYFVGYRLVELYLKGVKYPTTDLEKFKFVIKYFWLGLYCKEPETIQTNSKDLYVFEDSQFPPFQAMSSKDFSKDIVMKYAVFPAGVIRGALHNLGMKCEINIEVGKLPKCTFKCNVTNN